MPVDDNLVQRTDAKLRYAELHISELKSYSDLGQLDDWERAHLESVLFHLAGAFDAFLNEFNQGYTLELKDRDVDVNHIRKEVKAKNINSPAWTQLDSLLKDKGSWLSEMLELRHQGTHRRGIRRLVQIDAKHPSDKNVRLGRPNADEFMEQDQLGSLKDYSGRLRTLIQDLRTLIG